MQNFIKLAALVVIAAIGAFIIRALYISASSPRVAHQSSMVHLRAAADDLPDGLLLRDVDLVWKTMPSDQVPAGALIEEASGSDGKDLKGDLLRHAVRAGTPLGVADVILPSAPGFLAAALKPGMRAISVAVDDVSGNAGLIQPGDYVDILLTQQMRAETGARVDPARAVESETVAERVRVLAVGTAFRRPKDDDSASSTNAPSTTARTVTIEVTPASAQTITVAAHLGTLSLALRSFATRDRHTPDVEDVAMTHTRPVWAGDVSRALRAVSAPAESHSAKTPAPTPHVVIYRGSKVDQVDGELPGSTSMGAPGVPPLPTGTPPAAPARADAAPAISAGS
ncbi:MULTISPECIES: Flp pilus assembly protein CpaB [Paraburkholderia]|uniref:Flp pilus assembly protein CpaB n=1 Tax=Paraburkholderia podalyriae TaxID=1938811 RepID=A0ABR7PKY7_9BURK|nr:Flp pilus assembly protein CpaB [Paraburkholderia podalyriae]MBC8746965.1 Flp pilus assembly protein CpaB [Paraburkholderia podalyriae]